MKSCILFLMACAFVAVVNAELYPEAQELESLGFMDRRERRQWLNTPVAAVPQVVFPGQQSVVVPGQQVVLAPPTTFGLPDPRCYWSGTSPFCFGSCSKGFYTVRQDAKGDGKKCRTGNKKLCCPTLG